MLYSWSTVHISIEWKIKNKKWHGNHFARVNVISPTTEDDTKPVDSTTSEQQGENIAVAEPDPAVVAEQAVFRQEATPEASPNDADNNNNADTDAAVGGHLVEMSTSKQDKSLSPPKEFQCKNHLKLWLRRHQLPLVPNNDPCLHPACYHPWLKRPRSLLSKLSHCVHLKESTNVTAAVGILSLHSAFPVVSADNTTTPAGPILKDLPLHTLRRSPMAWISVFDC